MPKFDRAALRPAGPPAADAARFREHGVISPLKVLETSAVDEIRELLGHLTRNRAGELPPVLRAKPHLLVPQLWDLVVHPAVLAPVTAILGPDVLCFGTSLIWKPVARELQVSWHQDATHWGLSRPDAVTAWLALTPSTIESGCVLVAPGTHREAVDHDHPDDPTNMLGRKEVARAVLRDEDIVPLELNPGEMSIHHALVLHGSGQNRAGHDRIGFAMRYIAADNAQAGGRTGTATLVAGRDHGAYELEVEPEGLMHPAAMRRHTNVLRQGHRIIYGT